MESAFFGCSLDLSAIASGDVSTDPESLRFQYRVEETTSKPVSSKKTPTVYREQVEAGRVCVCVCVCAPLTSFVCVYYRTGFYLLQMLQGP